MICQCLRDQVMVERLSAMQQHGIFMTKKYVIVKKVFSLFTLKKMLSFFKDYRIRMCARDFNFEDLNTIHHELGHIQYDQHYKNLHVVFRDGANDGFHEGL